jgi:2-keto-3-deoxygluconate permease
MADPSYAAIAPVATVQVAASVIVTAVLTPILTSFVYKRVQRQRALEAQAAPAVMPLAAAPGDD